MEDELERILAQLRLDECAVSREGTRDGMQAPNTDAATTGLANTCDVSGTVSPMQLAAEQQRNAVLAGSSTSYSWLF